KEKDTAVQVAREMLREHLNARFAGGTRHSGFKDVRNANRVVDKYVAFVERHGYAALAEYLRYVISRKALTATFCAGGKWAVYGKIQIHLGQALYESFDRTKGSAR
ncbi:MAG: hypothetical protein NTX84_09035, partial [Nitrospirae bacterium]|nr:hypothetical protein [Nitrospirota bacterium]